MKKVSVVIPTKDEEATIGKVLDDLKKTILLGKIKNKYDVEIIIIADHCKDKTIVISKKKGAIVFKNKLPTGKGNALRYGFSKSKGEYIVMMDGDYSHRAEDLPKFLKALDSGAGMVIGSRIFGGSDEYTQTRALGNVLLTLVFGLLHGRYLSDALNGYKAFRSEVYKDFCYDSTEFEIEIELLSNTLRKGFSIVEISSHERGRAGGRAKSKVVKHGLKFLSRILKEYLKNKRFCFFPLFKNKLSRAEDSQRTRGSSRV